mgnify:FL=1
MDVESTQPEQASTDSQEDGRVELDSTQNDGQVTAEVDSNEVESGKEEPQENVEAEEKPYSIDDDPRAHMWKGEDGKIDVNKAISYTSQFEPKYQDQLRANKELQNQFDSVSAEANEFKQYLDHEVYGPAIRETIENKNKTILQDQLGIELPPEATNYITQTRSEVEAVRAELNQYKKSAQDAEHKKTATEQLNKIEGFAKEVGIDFVESDKSLFLNHAIDNNLSVDSLYKEWRHMPEVEKKYQEHYMKLGMKQAKEKLKKSQNGSLSSAGSRKGSSNGPRSIYEIAQQMDNFDF